MSIAYDDYLQEHRENVVRAYEWMLENIPEVIPENDYDFDWQIKMDHDWTKNEPEEYDSYDAYFYGINKSYKVIKDFNYAWLHHIHYNEHHWQHWVLINDDLIDGAIALDMPINYIIEMICDWWSFSFKTGNLYEIFDWYEEHKQNMVLSESTLTTVQNILGLIKEKLDKG